LQELYARMAATFGPFATNPPSVAERRERMSATTEKFGFPCPAEVTVKDFSIPLAGRSLPMRLYLPPALNSSDGSNRAPGLLAYFHGGGWVVGNIASHHGVCGQLALDSGVAVASVEYRKSPEVPFPGPTDDAYEATLWLAEHASGWGCDPTRLGVGGDSAGAHLATSVALRARDSLGAPKLAYQWLLYPTVEPVFDTESMTHNGAGPGLTRADMMWFWDQFLPGRLDSRDPQAVPSRAASLAGLPPAYVLWAEHDPLKDEGQRYAQLLQAAGVTVESVFAPAMTHGFARLQAHCAAARAHMLAGAQALGRALA
jgi:acetyl esterase